MNAKSALKGIGCILLGVAIFAASILICGLFIHGAAWVSSKLLPFFSVLTWIVLALDIFIFLPLAIPRTTRGVSSIALLISSYVFGATLWMEGFILTLILWGTLAVIIGLFIAGVGIVPIAILATLMKGMWGPFIELGLLVILTFGSRAGALALASGVED